MEAQMTLSKSNNGDAYTIAIEGRLDTLTAPAFEKEITAITDGETLLVDCAKLDYISSAGLRALLSAHKKFAEKGGMTVTNIGENIADIFEVTGFSNILTIR